MTSPVLGIMEEILLELSVSSLNLGSAIYCGYHRRCSTKIYKKNTWIEERPSFLVWKGEEQLLMLHGNSCVEWLLWQTPVTSITVQGKWEFSLLRQYANILKCYEKFPVCHTRRPKYLFFQAFLFLNFHKAASLGGGWHAATWWPRASLAPPDQSILTCPSDKID